MMIEKRGSLVERSALADLLDCPEAVQRSRGYYHTAREIASQPSVWLKTEGLVVEALPALAAFLAGQRRLLLSGAGSSHYVGLSLLPLLSGSFGCVEAIASTEILMDPESALPREPFVLVSFARSGESPEGNAVVDLAERLRPGLVRQLAFTCNRSGSLARLVGELGEGGRVLLLPEEANDRSLAMTASFSSLCLAGASLAYLGRPADYAALLESAARSGGPFIARAADLGAELAGGGFERAFFVASRPFLGGAFEARLKLQELTAGRVMASAEDCLGFRHGPLAAVDKRSLVVFCLSGAERRRSYELDLLKEIREKGLGAAVVAVGPRASELGGLADRLLDLDAEPSLPEGLLSVFVAVTGQLLGLFASLGQGLKPDEPSPEGVISRVVRGVRIHPEDGRP